MTVKLVILKSGEDLICDLSEMVTENGKVVGYFLKKPCVVKIKDFVHKKEEVEEKDEQNAKFNIVFYPWIPLSSSDIITIPVDWVVTMVDPIQKLLNMYKDQVLEYKNDDQSTSTIEQSDSNIED
jgi:hypothetical protein